MAEPMMPAAPIPRPTTRRPAAPAPPPSTSTVRNAGEGTEAPAPTGPTSDQLARLAAASVIPQEWYDEDHERLFRVEAGDDAAN